MSWCPFFRLVPNGPAVGFSKRNPTQAPDIRQMADWYPAPAGPENCHGASRVWRVFLPSWYKFYWVLARSRYKFNRNRKTIPGYKVGCGHWSANWRIAVQTIPEPEDCQVTEDKIASRCGHPGTRFSSIYLTSRVLQKPWQAYWPYRPCYKPLFYYFNCQSAMD